MTGDTQDQRLTDAEALAGVPVGTIVRSAAGTVACRFDDTRGVAFGDDRPFPWQKLALPCIVLWPLAARCPGEGPTDADERLRDLTGRLGFGDGVTEPQADNDTIVAWFEEQRRDAAEWREHEQFRIECAVAGHPDDEDCQEHVPTCCNAQHCEGPTDNGLHAAIEALADEWESYSTGSPVNPNTVAARHLRRVLAEHAPTEGPTRQAAARLCTCAPLGPYGNGCPVHDLAATPEDGPQ